MKILHSSDWHIGRYLYDRKRYDEFEAFFDWLLKEIELQEIDVLLVAGDIFDTSVPNNRAQEIYYRFLCNVAKSKCRHIVVIAGNHDSPSFISAPKNILKSLDVHVVGTVTENLEDEVIELKNDQGDLELLVCAVPYLRDKDVRKVQAGESLETKSENLVQGIKDHYAKVAEIAVTIRDDYLESAGKSGVEKHIPIIGMGHLFAAGGSPGEGVRDLYVGSLGYVSAETFPEEFDYVALGHLHIAQKVSSSEYIRYCGSPIPMGFGEAKQVKKIITLAYGVEDTKPAIQEIPIPNFQSLEKIAGDETVIKKRIEDLLSANSSIWLEVEYEGDLEGQSFREEILELLSGSEIELLRFKNKTVLKNYLSSLKVEEKLEDLSPMEVFKRCLVTNEVEEGKQDLLLASYSEVLKSIQEEDIKAE
ncbi:MAG: exonuclease SbcCD subunit D C-terminal domain-containing protein [Candidatus Caenarcaniphilales bacterium]|nr:exonuclease SbcCD subunit D C-terminal domain-containing protein [Candidatus Caenarcaniphilales bacterium]